MHCIFGERERSNDCVHAQKSCLVVHNNVMIVQMHRVVQRELSPSPLRRWYCHCFTLVVLPFLPLFLCPGVALPIPYNAVAVEKQTGTTFSSPLQRASSLDPIHRRKCGWPVSLSSSYGVKIWNVFRIKRSAWKTGYKYIKEIAPLDSLG